MTTRTKRELAELRRRLDEAEAELRRQGSRIHEIANAATTHSVVELLIDDAIARHLREHPHA